MLLHTNIIKYRSEWLLFLLYCIETVCITLYNNASRHRQSSINIIKTKIVFILFCFKYSFALHLIRYSLAQSVQSCISASIVVEWQVHEERTYFYLHEHHIAQQRMKHAYYKVNQSRLLRYLKVCMYVQGLEGVMSAFIIEGLIFFRIF